MVEIKMAAMSTIVLLVACNLAVASRQGEFCPPTPVVDCLIAPDVSLNFANQSRRSIPKFEYPRHVCSLDLARNNITEVPENAFIQLRNLSVLRLERNQITFIAVGAFNGLTRLLKLYLYDNDLGLNWPNSLPLNVFAPLNALQTLHLKGNRINSYKNLYSRLSPLRKLTRLTITGCQNCEFEPEFRQLSSLQFLSLSSSHIIRYGKCSIPRVKKDLFNNLPNLTFLGLSDCNITHIDPGTLSQLKHLCYLSLSHNQELTFTGVQNATEGLQNSGLKGLDMDRVNKNTGMGIMLTKNHTQHFPNLTSVTLDLNRLEVIEKGVIETKFSTVQEISLKGNRLVYDEFVLEIVHLKRLKTLEMDNQFLVRDPFWSDQGEGALQTTSNNAGYAYATWKCEGPTPFPIVLGDSIKTLSWSNSIVDVKITAWSFDAPSLVNLNLSRNLIEQWTGPIYNLTNLKILDLSRNNCDDVSVCFFLELTGLEFLDVSGNLLGDVLQRPKNQPELLFQNLRNLTTLKMSNNRIRILPKKIFSNLKNLRYLDISQNFISTLDLEVHFGPCFQEWDISYNVMEQLPDALTTFLDSLESQRVTSCNETRNIHVFLLTNPVVCACQSLDFLRWMSSTQVNITFSDTDECHLTDGSRVRLEDENVIPQIVEKLEKDCQSYLPLIVAGVILVTWSFTTVSAVLVFKNRWKLRHMYYKKRRRHYRSGYDRFFEYDAFISYADDDSSFIVSHVAPKLERERGVKLCIADRDFEAGCSIAENVTNAIFKSRKTILLVSSNYLKESWCNYEMNMAKVESVESRRDLIVAVMFEDIPTSEMSLSVMRFLQSERLLPYPSDEADHAQFWDNLVHLLE